MVEEKTKNKNIVFSLTEEKIYLSLSRNDASFMHL